MSVGRASVLLAIAGTALSLLAGAPAASAAAAFKPAADAYVRADNPKKAYGTAKTLRVDASPRVATYLRFSPSGLSGVVVRATLRLNAKGKLGAGIDVHPVADTGWSESKVTWANAPSMGATSATSGAVTASGPVDIDVTKLVTGNGPLSLGLTTTDSHALDISSRETGANAPQLIITVDTTAPARPAGLRATAGDGTVQLAWTANTDGDLAGYRVYRRIAGGKWSAVGADIHGAPAFVDDSVSNATTYEYRVTAFDTSNNESSPSASATATPRDMTPPAVPAGFDATAGDGKVDLRWSANSESDFASYRIYRRVSGGTWPTTPLATPTAATSLTDDTVVNGTPYEYRITSVDSNGNESAPSATVTATPVDRTPPAAPTGVQAAAGDGSVALQWSDNTEADLAGYRVYRHVVGADWPTTPLASPTTASWNDDTAVNGTTYEYRVTALDTNGNESAASPAVTATPVDRTPPGVPTGLSASAGDGSVDLSWSADTDGDLAGYRVYRRIAGGTWAAAAIATPTVNALHDVAVTNGTTYEYRVTAVDTNGNESSASVTASATPRDLTPPAVPVGVRAGAGDAAVTLVWTAGKDADLAGYRVYRRMHGGDWPPTAVATPTTAGFVDVGVSNGTAYDYRITAVDTNGNESAASAVVTATPTTPPPRTGPFQRGIWLNATEIAALPTTGPAWVALKAAADAALGKADVSDQDSSHDVRTLAAALVYARTQDPAYLLKADAGIAAAIGTEAGGRTLALGRNLMAYVIAADVIDLQRYDADLDARLRAWLTAVRSEVLDGKTLITTDELRPNNWGTLAGASRIAADIYLGDAADVARAAAVFQGWLGDRSVYAGFVYGDTGWQADPAQPVGINHTGSTIQGYDVDGALPEELRRGCPFQVPPCATGYPWEALQGAVAQAYMLSRLGYDAWSWSDRALLRAAQFLARLDQQYGGWWANGDDKWVPWVLNRGYGTTLPTAPVALAGKGMGWTDWMFGSPSSS
jgi:fibronectin type 3 domain-containing protein